MQSLLAPIEQPLACVQEFSSSPVAFEQQADVA